MKRLLTLIIIAALGFAVWQYPVWKAASEQLAEAERRVDAMIEKGINHVSFDDLPELRRLPANIRQAERLELLNISSTNVYDLSGLEGLENLNHLNANHTRVMDLEPLSGLPNLRLIYLHGTWADDLTPLTTLPALERLDIGMMQITSLEPLTRIERLNWLNLYRSYALDGSTGHFNTLESKVYELSGGNSYRQGYKPGWQYQMKVQYERLKDWFGITKSDAQA